MTKDCQKDIIAEFLLFVLKIVTHRKNTPDSQGMYETFQNIIFENDYGCL
jgi:hypothetical protein